jgi:hypothetical protein
MATAAIEAVASDWINWEGGRCPVSGDTRVQVQFRSDIDRRQAERASGPNGNVARAVSWANTGSGGDIIAYRVVRS